MNPTDLKVAATEHHTPIFSQHYCISFNCFNDVNTQELVTMLGTGYRISFQQDNREFIINLPMIQKYLIIE